MGPRKKLLIDKGQGQEKISSAYKKLFHGRDIATCKLKRTGPSHLSIRGKEIVNKKASVTKPGEFFSKTRCNARATLGMVLSMGSLSISVLRDESLAVSVDMKHFRGTLITTSPRFVSSVIFRPKPAIG